MKPNTFDGPRSIEEQAKLQHEAQEAKRRNPDMYKEPRKPRRVVEPVGLRAENYKWLVHFAGWTPVDLLSFEGPFHWFRDARLVCRCSLPEHEGIVLASFLSWDHPLCPKKKGDGAICPHPDPAPGGRVVAEMQRLVGRQFRSGEPVQPEDVTRILKASVPLLGRIETVTKDRKGRALAYPWSRIAEFKRADR